MNSLTVLIDFDNYFGRDTSKLNPEIMELSFSDIVRLCERDFNGINNINIRLYGGWHQNSSLTKQASIIQQHIHNIQVFPKIKAGKIIKGSIELASTLHLIPDFVWGHTFKETNGIPRIRINHDLVDDICNNNRENCPKFILYKFTQHRNKTCRVENCNNIHKEVFKGVQQKMVDTLIACDILSLVDDELIEGIFVISDDQDHFPSLALASIKNRSRKKKIVVGIKNNRNLTFVSNYLSPFNIQTTLIA